jgi:hypothetical protein
MKQFEFTTFNALMDGAGAGLKTHLALGMLNDVLFMLHRYKNPLEKDLSDIVDELDSFKAAMKAAAVKRERSTPVIGDTH